MLADFRGGIRLTSHQTSTFSDISCSRKQVMLRLARCQNSYQSKLENRAGDFSQSGFLVVDQPSHFCHIFPAVVRLKKLSLFPPHDAAHYSPHLIRYGPHDCAERFLSNNAKGWRINTITFSKQNMLVINPLSPLWQVGGCRL